MGARGERSHAVGTPLATPSRDTRGQTNQHPIIPTRFPVSERYRRVSHAILDARANEGSWHARCRPKHLSLYHTGRKTPSEGLGNPGLLGKGHLHRAAQRFPRGDSSNPVPVVALWCPVGLMVKNPGSFGVGGSGAGPSPALHGMTPPRGR